MSRIDVTELMTDPDFAAPITHITRVPQIDTYGVQHLAECSVSAYGVVMPVTGRELNRVPELARVANVQSFYLKGKITASGPNQYADILVSNGCRFQVLHVNDWSQWGLGWSEGFCVAEKPT